LIICGNQSESPPPPAQKDQPVSMLFLHISQEVVALTKVAYLSRICYHHWYLKTKVKWARKQRAVLFLTIGYSVF